MPAGADRVVHAGTCLAIYGEFEQSSQATWMEISNALPVVTIKILFTGAATDDEDI